ncbi:MAG: site-specific integrase [Eubacterium sp.]
MKKNRKNIYKRKDTRYEGRYIAGYQDIYGKAFYHSVYGSTYQEAASRLDKAEKNVEEELKLQRILRKQKNEAKGFGIIEKALKKEDYEGVNWSLTVGEWMVKWLEDHKKNTIRKSSYTRYYTVITNHIVPKIGKYNLSELSPVIIQDLIKYFCEKAGTKGNGLAPTTIRSYMIILSAALEKAIEQGLILVNPCKGATLPAKKYHEPVYLEPDECLKLEKMLLKTDDDPRSVAIMIALKTGLRLGELGALQWRDIDFENEIIHVRHSLQRIKTFATKGPKTKTVVDETKTRNSIRDIPMSDDIYNYLRMYYRSETDYLRIILPSDTFVFKNPNGDFIDPRVYQEYLKKVLRRAGIRYINFHALRHTFATVAASKDMQVAVLSRIMGHSNVALTLQLYVHSVCNQDKKEMSKIDWKFKSA